MIKNVAESLSSSYLNFITCTSCQEPFCLPLGSYFDASLDFVSLCLTLRGALKSSCLTLQGVQRALCFEAALRWVLVRCPRQLGGWEVSVSDEQGFLVLEVAMLAEVLLGQLLLPLTCSE